MNRFFLILGLLAMQYSSTATTSPAVDSLNDLAWQIRHEDFDRSVALVLQALERAEKTDYLPGQGKSYSLLGQFYLNKGLYEEAEQYFFQSLRVRESIPDSLGIAQVYDKLSFLKTGQGEYDKAIFYSLEAIRIAENLNLEEELGQFYLNLAVAYEENRDNPQAFHYYRQALDFYQKREDAGNAGRTFYNLGNLYREENKLDSAQLYYENALSRFETIGDSTAISVLYMGLGSVRYDQQDYEGAEAMYKKSMEINLRSKNDLYLYYSYSNLIDLCSQRKEFGQALQYCQQAEKILNKVGGLSDKRKLADRFSNLYSSLGQYEQALAYQRKAYALRDSLYNEEKSRQIAEIQTKYDTERLKRENAEKEVENQKRTSQMYTAYGVASFLLLSLFGGYFYYRYRQRTFRIITQQNDQIHRQEIDDLMKSQELAFIGARLDGQEVERKRIAKELHDGVGSMLVAAKWQYEHALEIVGKRGGDTTLLRKANQKLSDTYEELRKVAFNVSTGNIQKVGLLSAVNDLCQTISDTGKIKARLSTFGNFEDLDEKIERSLYRVIQELISNTLKHAKASKIEIQLNKLSDELNLIVEDDGQGFDPARVNNNSLGLNSIESRIQGLNGQVDFDSGKGAGTTVIINIPLEEKIAI